MTPRMSPFTLVLLGLSLAASANAKLFNNGNCPADPYADPAHDICNPYRYIPNKPANIVGVVLFFAVAIALFIRNWRQRANFFLCVIIGAAAEAIGFILRLLVRNKPHSQGLFIAMTLFVVLPPCAFLAGNYILLGRLTAHLGAERQIRPLKPRFVSWTFIASDVITFIIQGIGGAVSVSSTISTAKIGGKVFLAGISAQLASFALFCILWLTFTIRMHMNYVGNVADTAPNWKRLNYALGFTCVVFLIRSVYRTIELSGGVTSKLATHEVYFLCLDSIPILIGITTYIFFWPGAYLTPESRVVGTPDEINMSEAGQIGK